ncbi:hypothetical protein DRQ53_07425 [bacterium]|nr:MAG: hypothetical protein DRQ32_11995 [bacterium]RKZ16036.1 MAG: hypothetical protein DRQ53_07425 [bacterium]
MRRLIPLLCTLALLAPSGATAKETLLWLSIGTGLTWYNEIDPDELEVLATAGSILPNNPTSGRTINFDEKSFEIPALVQFGIRINENVNLWAMYQRLPYLLDAPIPGPDAGGSPSNPPDDTIRLRAPANVFGGGMDFRLGRDGYFESMILSLGLGQISFTGQDEDVITLTNFTVDGKGLMYEAQLMFEVDFARDLKFYPFLAFRYADVDNTNAEYIRDPSINPALPSYSINYTGVTVGITARFKLWPFDSVDDDSSIFDD